MTVNKREETIESLKKFWAKNKTKLFVTTTVILAIGVAMQKEGLNQHNDFLKEHDLLEDFYRSIGADDEEIEEFMKN